MFNWAKQTLANVAGTEEPIYGPSAIQTVTAQAKSTPYTELQKSDLKWLQRGGTNVETATFYFTADNGYIGMAQIIYSSVAGIRKTVQFNTKLFPPNSGPILWASDPVDDYSFPSGGLDFSSPSVSVTLNPAGDTYTIKSTLNSRSIVSLTVTRTTPGVVIGKDGTTQYGTDPARPWGSMMHAFWPRCTVAGNIITSSGPIDFAGKGLYVHALQGMKPHHAAARWNFLNFQSADYSAVAMEFTTPPSYGSTTVTVGVVVKGDKIVFAGEAEPVQHTGSQTDQESGWPEPTGYKASWDAGKFVLQGDYGKRVDRVDVMAEVPGFVKTIVATAAGTKPYIFQFLPPSPTLLVTDGATTSSEAGHLFTEATFISGA